MTEPRVFTGGRIIGRQDWATPRALFDEWHREFGFTVDVCASSWNAKLPRFYDEHTNGLAQSWDNERVWCNPPYGSIEPWLQKAIASTARGTFSVFLLPASTGTGWYHDLAMLGQVHLFRGRISFEAPPGVESKDRPTFAPMLVIYDPSATRSGVVATRSAKTGKMLAPGDVVRAALEAAHGT